MDAVPDRTTAIGRGSRIAPDGRADQALAVAYADLCRPRLYRRRHLPAALYRDDHLGAPACRTRCWIATSCPATSTSIAFIDIWSTGFGHNLRISLEVAGGSTLLVLLVAIPAAYYTARQRFRGRAAFMLLVLVTQMFQPTAMLVGLYREFLNFGMLDSVLALILVNAGFNMAFAVWILNAYVGAIPAELEEAAFIDGSTRLGRAVPHHPAAGAARHRDGAHLHLHQRLERVHRRPDADDLAGDRAADGRRSTPISASIRSIGAISLPAP